MKGNKLHKLIEDAELTLNFVNAQFEMLWAYDKGIFKGRITGAEIYMLKNFVLKDVKPRLIDAQKKINKALEIVEKEIAPTIN